MGKDGEKMLTSDPSSAWLPQNYDSNSNTSLYVFACKKELNKRFCFKNQTIIRGSCAPSLNVVTNNKSLSQSPNKSYPIITRIS